MALSSEHSQLENPGIVCELVRLVMQSLTPQQRGYLPVGAEGTTVCQQDRSGSAPCVGMPL
jgi:hypothetical protein